MHTRSTPGGTQRVFFPKGSASDTFAAQSSEMGGDGNPCLGHCPLGAETGRWQRQRGGSSLHWGICMCRLHLRWLERGRFAQTDCWRSLHSPSHLLQTMAGVMPTPRWAYCSPLHWRLPRVMLFIRKCSFHRVSASLTHEWAQQQSRGILFGYSGKHPNTIWGVSCSRNEPVFWFKELLCFGVS